MNPEYPIYIPSKGRWESRLTVKSLQQMGVPFKVVVEESEYAAYAEVIDPSSLLILDPQYQVDYDACGDFPVDRKGSGPARNFIWDHAQASGAACHWVMDDNLRGFYRMNQNHIHPLLDGTALRLMESFCERYDNVALAGPQYEKFVKHRQTMPPFALNTRIFSCILIRNDLPFRWRARFNEDVDLSLRVLKAGYCTVEFNAFLQGKVATLTMRGGNTDTIYTDGTLPKAQMIARLHPDVCRVGWKFSRWHHECDYRPFKHNRLIRRPGVEIPTEPNEYGMRLVKVAR